MASPSASNEGGSEGALGGQTIVADQSRDSQDLGPAVN